MFAMEDTDVGNLWLEKEGGGCSSIMKQSRVEGSLAISDHKRAPYMFNGGMCFLVLKQTIPLKKNTLLACLHMLEIHYICVDCSRAVCLVFERVRAPRHFFLGKGHAVMKLQSCTGVFQGRQGNDQGTRRQSPPLPP